jgi:hypothetical protein
MVTFAFVAEADNQTKLDGVLKVRLFRILARAQLMDRAPKPNSSFKLRLHRHLLFCVPFYSVSCLTTVVHVTIYFSLWGWTTVSRVLQHTTHTWRLEMDTKGLTQFGVVDDGNGIRRC